MLAHIFNLSIYWMFTVSQCCPQYVVLWRVLYSLKYNLNCWQQVSVCLCLILGSYSAFGYPEGFNKLSLTPLFIISSPFTLSSYLYHSWWGYCMVPELKRRNFIFCPLFGFCGKFWKRWEYQTTWPASWETCMQVRKQ